MATQTLPSRSSKRLKMRSPERPSDSRKYICSAVMYMYEPPVECSDPETAIVVPEKSVGIDGLPAPGIGYNSAFPWTSCLIPPGIAMNSSPSSPSIQIIELRSAASHNALEDRASIAKARTVHRPRDRLYCPHTKTKPFGLECRPARSTAYCRFVSRRAGQWEYPNPPAHTVPLWSSSSANTSCVSSSGYRVSLAPFQLDKAGVRANPKSPVARGEQLCDCAAR